MSKGNSNNNSNNTNNNNNTQRRFNKPSEYKRSGGIRNGRVDISREFLIQFLRAIQKKNRMYFKVNEPILSSD